MHHCAMLFYITMTRCHGLDITQDTTSVLIAGITSELSITVDVIGDEELIAVGDELTMELSLTSSGAGCPPSSSSTSSCTSGSFTFTQVVPTSRSFLLTATFPDAIDFSLVDQHLLASITLLTPSLTTSNIRISAVVQGEAPTVVERSTAMTAGPNGSASVSVEGTGFSRYVDMLDKITIRALTEKGIFLKPSLNLQLASETLLVFNLSTSCDGVDVPLVDLSLVGNRLVVSQITITGSGKSSTGRVPVTGVIVGPSALDFTINTKVDFNNNLLTFTGTLFSCSSNATRVVLTSSGNGLLPEVTILTISSESITMALVSCDGTLSALDRSLSGMSLSAQIVIDSITEISSAVVSISDTLPIERPTVAFTTSGTEPHVNDAQLVLSGSGFSCLTSLYTVILSSPQSKGLRPLGVISSATFTDITVSVTTDVSGVMLPGLDAALIGATLDVELQLTADDETDVANGSMGTIIGENPQVSTDSLAISICLEENDTVEERVNIVFMADYVPYELDELELRLYIAGIIMPVTTSLFHNTTGSFIGLQFPLQRVALQAADRARSQKLEVEMVNLASSLSSTRSSIGAIAGSCPETIDPDNNNNKGNNGVQPDTGKGMGGGLIAGIIIGVVALVGLIVELIYSRKKSNGPVENIENFVSVSTPSREPPVDATPTTPRECIAIM